MADVWVVVSVLAFFGVCVALVRGCDLMIGPDDASDLADLSTSDAEELTEEAAVR
jgi:hypothetical protein